ncbi:MAG: hypothetical protein ACPGVK_11470 [Halocynthiibacter sp.]
MTNSSFSGSDCRVHISATNALASWDDAVLSNASSYIAARTKRFPLWMLH